MSNRGHSTDASDRAALERLEKAVGRALERIADLERHLEGARARSGQLEELLRSFRTGEEEPAEMKARLERLSKENIDMRTRLDEGRAAVERLLARIRFLEDQR